VITWLAFKDVENLLQIGGDHLYEYTTTTLYIFMESWRVINIS